MISRNSQTAFRFVFLLGASLLVLTPGAGFAQQKAPDARSSSPAKPAEAASDPKNSQYCANIANAAADARFEWQKETLTNLEKEIEGRIKVLEEKRAEYEEWLRRRNEFLAKADESVVAIYARMRPEAAALQLANMQDDTAAAILAKLGARSASAVLNEMEPARAAQLSNTINDTPKRPQDNGKAG
jgi:flagellar motility protein MotE (MotC chaperone)